jgi:outer membrane receptor protein involved in Fe transport
MGYTGNQGIGAYASLAHYISSNYPFEGTLESGYILSGTNPGNANLKWETTKQQNIGLDISILRSRINFTMDVYYKHTYDLLQYSTVAMSTGVQQIPMNIGEVENKGLELSLDGVPVITKDFKWKVSANWSYNRNKVLKYGKSSKDQATYGPYRLEGLLLKEGYPIGQLNGYVEEGYWNSIDEYKASPFYAYIQKHTPSDVPTDALIVQNYLGEIKYQDINGDSIINEKDRTSIGNVNPDYILGFTNTFDYKNLSLSVFFQGVVGNDILNAILLNFNSTSTWSNRPPELLDKAWTIDRAQNNPGIIKYPKMGENLSRNTRFSRRYVEDGSYLKLKNVTLSYKLNSPFKFKYIKQVTISLSGTNLLTFTKYSGFDPEVNSAGSGNASWRGIDVGAYPSSRTITMGVNLLF